MMERTKKINGIVSPDLSLYKPGDISTQELLIRMSSGTTGAPKLVLRRSEKRTEEDNYGSLLRLSHLHSIFSIYCQLYVQPSLRVNRLLCLSPKDIEHKDIEHILREFKATTMAGGQSYFFKLVRKIGDKKIGAILSDIRTISFSSELIPQKLYRRAQSLLKKATIQLHYSSAETGFVGQSCPYIADFHLDKGLEHTPLHPREDCAIEIRNPDHNGLGEFIAKRHGKKIATGDMGKLIDEMCRCGKQKTLLIYGRYNFDIVHCVGATLLSSDLEKIFNTLENYVSDYLVEVREIENNLEVRGELTFLIIPTKKLLNKKNPKNYIALKISAQLFLTNTRTLDALVREGIFLKPKVQFVTAFPEMSKKIHLRKVFD